MRTLLGLVILGAPALALAQPAPPGPPPPASPPPPSSQPPQDPYQPSTGQPPYAAPPPATSPSNGPYGPGAGTAPYTPPPPAGPPQGAPPPQQPYGQPGYGQGPYGQPGYGPPYQPYGPQYAPPPRPLRSGMTFEANLGLGWIRLGDANDSDTSNTGLGGLCLGVGGWVGSKTAITARLAGVNYTENDVRFSAIFLGPSVQHWIDDHLWLGGGIGLGIFGATNTVTDEGDAIGGLGLDLRVGYSFNTTSENTFNVSFEVNPSFLEENGQRGTATGIALLVGYQHL